MNGRKPAPDEDIVVVPSTEEFREADLGIHKSETPFSESISTAQAPDIWPSPPDEVESDFVLRLHQAIQECRELGYHPTRFEQMLSELGAVKLAKRLVVSADLQDGLKTISRLGRKDLALESIMLEPKFQSLFTASELQAASWRLTQV